MKLLLDTHALLWWLEGSPRLGLNTRREISSPRNEVLISAVCAWEIAIKVGLGRLDLGEPPEICLPREIQRNGFRPLSVEISHGCAVRSLPDHHRDPFDRLLVAQALREGLTLVTADPLLYRYPVTTLPAGR
jgi:PIN domain nuclease of toxin-antitoxin system